MSSRSQSLVCSYRESSHRASTEDSIAELRWACPRVSLRDVFMTDESGSVYEYVQR